MESTSQDLNLEDVSIISDTPVRTTSKCPVKIIVEPKVTPLIITAHGPILYSSDKAIPWNYGANVYYHGVKQEPLTVEEENVEVTNPDVDNIAGTSKVTRNGRVFSPEISSNTVTAPVCITVIESTTEIQNK